MKLLLLSLAALLSLACSGPAPSAEPAPGEVANLHEETPEALPELPAVVAEPAPVNRLRAEWTLDEAFSTEEVRIIVAAGDVWAGVTDGRVALTFKVGPVEPGQPWAIRRGKVEPGTPGRTTVSADGPRVVLDADMLSGCEEKLLLVATHELGHTLGIEGHGHTGGVMTTDRVPGCAFAVLPEDLEMFETANPL